MSSDLPCHNGCAPGSSGFQTPGFPVGLAVVLEGLPVEPLQGADLKFVFFQTGGHSLHFSCARFFACDAAFTVAPGEQCAKALCLGDQVFQEERLALWHAHSPPSKCIEGDTEMTRKSRGGDEGAARESGRKERVKRVTGEERGSDERDCVGSPCSSLLVEAIAPFQENIWVLFYFLFIVILLICNFCFVCCLSRLSCRFFSCFFMCFNWCSLSLWNILD